MKKKLMLKATRFLGSIIFTAILLFGASAIPAQAAGLTSSQISAIVALLFSFGADQSTINSVEVALNGGAPTTGDQPFCYNFNYDITIGNSGADVLALHRALSSLGMNTSGNTSIFTEGMASDVVTFQARYGIRQSGYVGPLTRKRLNTLYGCTHQTDTQQVQAVVAATPPAANPATTVGTLIPSDTFMSFNVVQGASNPPFYNMHLTNASTKTVNFTLSVLYQPSWLNTGYVASTLTLVPGGVMGLGASVDASKVGSPGTYTTHLVITGDFPSSPISIPITLVVTAAPPLPTSIPNIDTFSVNGNSDVINGKVHIYNVTNPTMQWSASNASYCIATSVEGITRAPTSEFTGTKPTSGTEQLVLGHSYYNQREIMMTCYSQSGTPSNTVDAWIGGKG